MAISLQKGQRISLKKNDGSKLTHICIGVNWGAIQKKGWFGTVKQQSVDLDATVGLFDQNKSLVEAVYFSHLQSNCGGIRHSGDDLTGDINGDDGLDNEVISIDLVKLNPNIVQIALVLNSFKGDDFKDIPYAKIRIFEGTPTSVEQVFATFDVANDAIFSGKVAMIMAKLYKHNDEWKFNSIGQATDDRDLKATLKTFAETYF